MSTDETAAPGEGMAEGAGAARTGHPQVDAVFGQLRELDDLPLAEHVGVFEQAHRSLQDALAGLHQD